MPYSGTTAPSQNSASSSAATLNTIGGTVTGRKARKSSSAAPRVLPRSTTQEIARLAIIVRVGTATIRIAVLRMMRRSRSVGMLRKLPSDMAANASAEGGRRNGSAEAQPSISSGSAWLTRKKPATKAIAGPLARPSGAMRGR